MTSNKTVIYFLLCVILLWLPACICFHHDTTLKIDALDGNVNQISVNGNNLVVFKGGLDDTQVLIYSSPNFTNKYQINASSPLKSPPVINNPNQIYLNYGNYIDTIQIKKRKTVYDIDEIRQNKMAVINNIAIFPQSLSKSPNIYFINIDTNAIQKVSFSTGDTRIFKSFVFGLSGNYFLLVQDNFMFIVDINTKQNVSFYHSENIMYPQQISTYYNTSVSNKLSILVQAGSDSNIIYTQFPSAAPKFTQKLFYNPTQNMKLLSSINNNYNYNDNDNDDKYIAVSFFNFQRFHWRKFHDNLLTVQQQKSQDQSLIQQFPISTFNNQSTFVINLSGFDQLQIIFYDYDKISYQISYKFTIKVPLGYCGVAEHSGQISQNQLFMFGDFVAADGSRFVIKLDLVQRNYTFVMKQNNLTQLQKCAGFALIDNDYIVTLCNIVPKVSYELQLRNTIDLKIISRMTINSTQPYLKILYNQAWKKTFLVQQFNGTRKNLIPTKKYQVILSQTTKQIQYTNISSTELTVDTKTTSKYIISYIDRQFVDNGMYFFSIQTLKRDRIIYYGRIREQGLYSVYVNKDIVIVQSGIEPYTVDVLDLSKEDNIGIGSFFMKYFQGGSYKHRDIQWMMFPQAGQLYLYNYKQPSEKQPVKVVYDIKNLPISSHKGDNTKKCDTQLYVPVEQQLTDYRQSFLYYLSDKSLYFNDGVYPTEQFPLDIPTDITIQKAQFYFASNRKNIILRYQIQATQNRYRIQIRSANRPQQILWYHISDEDMFYNVDLTLSNKIILNTLLEIQLFKLQNTQSASQYQIVQFTVMDVSVKGCMIMLGNNYRNNTVTNIIFKMSYDSFYNNKAEVQNFKPKIIVLSQNNCSLFASYGANENFIQIWMLDSINRSIKKISQYQYIGVESVKFYGDNKIVIFAQGKLFYETFNTTLLFPNSSPLSSTSLSVYPDLMAGSTIQIYSISKNSQYLAYTKDKKLAFINNTSTKKTAAVFEVSQSSLINGLTFSQDNSLYISTNSTKLYIIASSDCPSQNFIMINLQCICPDDTFDNSKGQCLCPQGNYTADWKCLACEFPCATCQNQSKNCITYRGFFYAIIIVPSVFIIVVIVAVVIWLKKKKKRTFVELEQEHQEEGSAGKNTLISGKESQN